MKNFTRFFGASSDRAGFEDLCRYQLRMRNQGIGAATISSMVSALRFLFKVTLRRAKAVDQLCYVRRLNRACHAAVDAAPASRDESRRTPFHLHAYETVAEAKAGIRSWISF